MGFNGDLSKKSLAELDVLLINRHKLLAEARLYDSREAAELREDITKLQYAMNAKRQADKEKQWRR